MDEKTKSLLLKCVETLNEIEAQAISGEISHHFLEITESKERREIVIGGNAFGLAYLAKTIIDVAIADFEGAHNHIDSSGIADVSEIPVIVRLKSPDWTTEP
jgi:hypothetical protein